MTYYDYQITIQVASDTRLSEGVIRKQIKKQIKKFDGFSLELEIKEYEIEDGGGIIDDRMESHPRYAEPRHTSLVCQGRGS